MFLVYCSLIIYNSLLELLYLVRSKQVKKATIFKNIIILFVSFLLYSIVQLLYFYPTKVQNVLKISSTGFVVLVIIVTVLAILLLIYLYHKQLAEENDWDFNYRPHWSIRRLAIAIIGFVLLTLASFIIPNLLGINVNTTSDNQMELNRISRLAGNFFVPMVVIIAPIFEETIFRGMFFNTFFVKETVLNKWLGIIISGFAFGYVHNPAFSPFLLVYWSLGCVLGWVYITTKDMRYSMLSHMLYNALGFLV